MSSRKANENKFKEWRNLKNGGRIYSRKVFGQHGWYAVYWKETNSEEETLKFWQEIYNSKNQLVEIHEKYPEDKGHKKYMR